MLHKYAFLVLGRYVNVTASSDCLDVTLTYPTVLPPISSVMVSSRLGVRQLVLRDFLVLNWMVEIRCTH